MQLVCITDLHGRLEALQRILDDAGDCFAEVLEFTVFPRFHRGSAALRSFIDRVQPGLVFCGHIHEGRGTERSEARRNLPVDLAPHRSVLPPMLSVWGMHI